MTTGSAATIRDEFDRLAAFGGGWDGNAYHHPRLLRALPPRMGVLLDAGCGAGAFARAVAPRCARVVAIDLSPAMIARAKSEGVPANVELAVGDALEIDFPEASFDAIVSIAAVHHMDTRVALTRFASLLRPGGTLAVLDLYQSWGMLDLALSGVSAGLAPLFRWQRTRRLFPSPEIRAAWALHEAHDTYETIRNLTAIAGETVPGAAIRRLLFWRYALTWTKPA